MAVVALAAAACSSGEAASDESTAAAATTPVATSGDVVIAEPAPVRPRFRYPPAPAAPAADVQSAPEALDAIDTINQLLGAGELDLASVSAIRDFGDLRHAWYLSDLLRFFRGEQGDIIAEAFEQLAGVQLNDDPDRAISQWLSVTNHLIAWDTPSYPGYRDDKAGVFLLVEPAWEPFFADEEATLDWRFVSWGGVLIDDRELGDSEPCPRGCIPSLDDPATTDAAGGDWYPDDRIVFGLVEGGEALAVPKNIAEIHEMFNLTLGGRRLALPYCTLCGSAQAYSTDDSGAAEQPVLRTSGLLIRSNKVMYDLVTASVFDTFTGEAVTGPLREDGIVLDEATVVTSTWADWKAAHPDTRIIAEDGGIGRTYELDPLGGRDDEGPIFPIGDADERLDVQELVVGVITADGTPVAFPVVVARSSLDAGSDVELGGVRLVADGGGLRAVDAATGDGLSAHEAFWFAWSQFHPDTLLYER
ncbi:MAG: DUF3179 domain-containing protein [Ilumatobacter sp.]|nr:DUF3179 domain-containing protein [Ilumatobacter sp.]